MKVQRNSKNRHGTRGIRTSGLPAGKNMGSLTWFYQSKDGIILRNDFNLRFRVYRTDKSCQYWESKSNYTRGTKLTPEILETLKQI